MQGLEMDNAKITQEENKKKRGRPRKIVIETQPPSPSQEQPKKRRGRPPKNSEEKLLEVKDEIPRKIPYSGPYCCEGMERMMAAGLPLRAGTKCNMCGKEIQHFKKGQIFEGIQKEPLQ